MKSVGGGDREVRGEAQRSVSFETKVVSLACGSAAAAGVRREMVSTRETEGLVRRALRMWDPCPGTDCKLLEDIVDKYVDMK